MTRDRDRETDAADAGDPFLARWSRRKHAAQETDAPVGGPGEPEADGAAAADAGQDDAAAMPDAPAEEDLPPPETLGPDSDFSAYLSRRVSGGLRRAAMRRLFSLPDFNVRDGLDDYDEDYTQFAALGDTVTADMKYHAERRRAQQEDEDERVAARDPASAEGDDPAAPGSEDPDAAERERGPDRDEAADDGETGEGEADGIA